MSSTKYIEKIHKKKMERPNRPVCYKDSPIGKLRRLTWSGMYDTERYLNLLQREVPELRDSEELLYKDISDMKSALFCLKNSASADKKGMDTKKDDDTSDSSDCNCHYTRCARLVEL